MQNLLRTTRQHLFQIVRLLARDAQKVLDRVLRSRDFNQQKVRHQLSQVPRGKATKLLSLPWGCCKASAPRELASTQQREGCSSLEFSIYKVLLDAKLRKHLRRKAELDVPLQGV